jgi:hypothetical protein
VRGACGIAIRLLRVLSAIQLYDQMLVETDEISEVASDWVLAPELEMGEVAVAEQSP